VNLSLDGQQFNNRSLIHGRFVHIRSSRSVVRVACVHCDCTKL